VIPPPSARPGAVEEVDGVALVEEPDVAVHRRGDADMSMAEWFSDADDFDTGSQRRCVAVLHPGCLRGSHTAPAPRTAFRRSEGTHGAVGWVGADPSEHGAGILRIPKSTGP
jgi:hypothetical protein